MCVVRVAVVGRGRAREQVCASMSQQPKQESGVGAASTQPIVHIRGDSDSDLEALFSVLSKNPEPSKSFKHKKLPDSFFIQPDPALRGVRVGEHSREGSQDSTASGYAPPRQVAGLSIDHRRSQSSPAQLPLSLSAPPPPAAVHVKQQSVDLLAEDPHHGSAAAWPDQGKPTATGQRYYLK